MEEFILIAWFKGGDIPLSYLPVHMLLHCLVALSIWLQLVKEAKNDDMELKAAEVACHRSASLPAFAVRWQPPQQGFLKLNVDVVVDMEGATKASFTTLWRSKNPQARTSLPTEKDPNINGDFTGD
ncbi:unnamed protein product [Prunus armeniaca]